MSRGNLSLRLKATREQECTGLAVCLPSQSLSAEHKSPLTNHKGCHLLLGHLSQPGTGILWKRIFTPQMRRKLLRHVISFPPPPHFPRLTAQHCWHSANEKAKGTIQSLLLLTEQNLVEREYTNCRSNCQQKGFASKSKL